MTARYSIRAIAEKTGLSAHTIRAWERRYSLLAPQRTDGNRRIYSEADVTRLRLITQALDAGHAIGMIANLPNEDLAQLRTHSRDASASSFPSEDFFGICRQAMLDMDADLFKFTLGRATAVLGVERFVLELVIPLLSLVNEGWQSGGVSIAHEHFATALLRTELEQLRFTIAPRQSGPRMIVTTPSGHIHELGALLVAVTAARLGWKVTYLGPNLPAAEISASARQINAELVALSLTHPQGDERTIGELLRLREQLGPRVPVLVGGGAAPSYQETLDEIGAVMILDLDLLADYLSKLHSDR